MHGLNTATCYTQEVQARACSQTPNSVANFLNCYLGASTMKYLHTMVRVTGLDQSLEVYCTHLGLENMGRFDIERPLHMVFLAAPTRSTNQADP